jgi:hypothetical protein
VWKENDLRTSPAAEAFADCIEISDGRLVIHGSDSDGRSERRRRRRGQPWANFVPSAAHREETEEPEPSPEKPCADAHPGVRRTRFQLR